MVGPLLTDPTMWRLAAARATGRSHLRSGLPCQDRFAYQVLPDGSFIAALADGAGSASNAEVGAETAVHTVVSHLQQALTSGRTDLDLLMGEAASHARDAVIAVADIKQAEPRSFASTLLAVILVADRGAAMQIGDGAMVIKNSYEEWMWVFWPQRGEYANTTYFLTDETALQRLQIDTLPGAISDVALMSDGLEPLALHYANKGVHQPFFNGMFRPLLETSGTEEIKTLSDSLQQFLASEQVSSRTDDDVSIILATRRPCQSVP